jgi:hypothetical protein
LFSSNGIYSFTRKDFAKSMTYATKVWAPNVLRYLKIA